MLESTRSFSVVSNIIESEGHVLIAEHSRWLKVTDKISHHSNKMLESTRSCSVASKMVEREGQVRIAEHQRWLKVMDNILHRSTQDDLMLRTKSFSIAYKIVQNV